MIEQTPITMTKRRDGDLKSRKYREASTKDSYCKKQRHVELARARIAKAIDHIPPLVDFKAEEREFQERLSDDRVQDEWDHLYKGNVYQDLERGNLVFVKMGGCSSCGYPLSYDEQAYRQSVMDYIDQDTERFVPQLERVELTDDNIVYMLDAIKKPKLTPDQYKEALFKRLETAFIDEYKVGTQNKTKTRTWTPWGRM